MVQGDRDARGCEDAARKIAEEFARQLISVNLGAYGKLVEIFTEAGCPANYFSHRGDRGVVPEDTSNYFDCLEISTNSLPTPWHSRELAWGVRLGAMMATSDAFLFFPGREGTLAHLAPILAFDIKLWGAGKKVAFVGWDEEKERLLWRLFPALTSEWSRCFDISDEADKIVDFLTD